MMQADTFVIVDISNPRPDSIKWRFPPGIQIINNSNPFSPIIISSDTGNFYVKAIAYFGSCADSLNKLVHFIKYDSTAIKNGAYRGIKTFSLYPNPNSGQFNVVLEFYKKQTFVIKINTTTGSEVFQAPAQYGDSATIPINMPINTPGNYFIKVIAEFDAKQKGFIITN
ncbi:MAG: T9SS type A sorting domain-containing protein [Bacteroidia bacterium]